ncbi:homoprotocatechuate degradation operon regulator HpaR [Rhizobium lentis]|uniref:homoprotocatechuate degradation operon regulator HpaR n=1 Tax=Rhizobium TaxID=379 RepID=UPI001C82C39D|nr:MULTISPECIES: homoprotocatechuate degradation operon regulator HpaR [Rhizobium]MBX4922306.1 homoprotocatechuate degradation operon regulator HpaR [Rhizobium bangladeshense]MBX5101187.1 homoprotocatechuate degradation operon regulator HpaR [Rhizobium lentis]MBY3599263.1 homoprotocatechuate degradation operon regulator HpaR [Rhizobium bangladeshense]
MKNPQQNEIAGLSSPGGDLAQEHRRSLAIGLLRAREAVMSHFRPILAAHDVTEQQWRVIRVLSEVGTLDASEVADKASILAPSLTRMIRSLEERGLITKHKDRADGRRVLLRITPAGQATVNQVMPDSLKVYADIDARFGTERVEQLLDMLDELAALKLEGATGEEE